MPKAWRAQRLVSQCSHQTPASCRHLSSVTSGPRNLENSRAAFRTALFGDAVDSDSPIDAGYSSSKCSRTSGSRPAIRPSTLRTKSASFSPVFVSATDSGPRTITLGRTSRNRNSRPKAASRYLSRQSQLAPNQRFRDSNRTPGVIQPSGSFMRWKPCGSRTGRIISATAAANSSSIIWPTASCNACQALTPDLTTPSFVVSRYRFQVWLDEPSAGFWREEQ